MQLKPGDLVETAGGKFGRVIYTFRMTVFVGFSRLGADDYVTGFLESDLRKVDLGNGHNNPSAPAAMFGHENADRYQSAACAVD